MPSSRCETTSRRAVQCCTTAYFADAPVSLTPESQMVGCHGTGSVGIRFVGTGAVSGVATLSGRRTRMNVLTLMVIIILAYWAIAMYAVSKQKDWE